MTTTTSTGTTIMTTSRAVLVAAAIIAVAILVSVGVPACIDAETRRDIAAGAIFRRSRQLQSDPCTNKGGRTDLQRVRS